MQTVIADQEPLDYFIDLSSINIIDDNGQIWVPDESMVDISVISSDPDTAWIDFLGTHGKIYIGRPGLATIEFSIWYEGRMVAVNCEPLVVIASKEQQPVQMLELKLQFPEEAA